jgi:flagellar hook-length control protein FliK
MTQLTVAPQSMPVIASTQSAAVPGTEAGAVVADSAENAETSIDFAAVLQARIAQPAKDALETEIIAALLPSQTTEVAEVVSPTEVAEVVSPMDGLPVASDLAVLLANMIPPAARMPSANPSQQSAEPVKEEARTNAVPIGANSFMPGRGATTAFGNDTPLDTLLPTKRTIAYPAQPLQTEGPALLSAADPQMPVASAEQAQPITSAPVTVTSIHLTPAGEIPRHISIDTPVDKHGWDAEVGQKILLLVNRQESRAELTLTPPQFGKVEVTISINGDQTSATFVSASPAAREALEQALPRLREMMAEAGISLGQASVNAESVPRGQDESHAQGHGNGRGTNAALSADTPAQWVRQGSGLIDTYA